MTIIYICEHAIPKVQLKNIPCWSFPVWPCLFTQHLVSFKTRIIWLPEGITCSSDPDIFKQTKVTNLMSDKSIIKNMGCLLVIWFNTPEKLTKSANYIHQT